MSIFNQNAKKRRKNNQFDLSYEKKLTTKFGNLTPFYTQETLPGDQININSEIKTELAPLLSDLNHMIDVHVDYFWVSYDSIWKNWRSFISGGENNDENPTLPYVTYNNTTSNKNILKSSELGDYLGLPAWNKQTTVPTVTGTKNFNALPFRAYQHIYNEWYRDQDLIQKIDIQKDTDGLSDHTKICTLRKSSWEHDIFTTARPEAQKGDPVNFLARNDVDEETIIRPDGGAITAGGIIGTATGVGGKILDSNFQELDLYATVAQLRKGEALQAFYETMQRAGNRYNEYLNAFWGVDDQDQRLLIPTLLGSSDHPLQIQEVITTSNNDNTVTDDNTAAQAYGRGTGYGKAGVNYTAPDYGIIIGIIKYIPRASYYNPLPEYWSRTNRLQWYTDHLAEIGEDSIKKQEVFFSTALPADTTHLQEFGYHHRYYAFKTRHDEVSGDFKHSLSFRHMSRDLTTWPNLNQDFIEVGGIYDTFTLTRIFNVIDPNLDYIWTHAYHDALYNRDVKYTSTPLT